MSRSSLFCLSLAVLLGVTAISWTSGWGQGVGSQVAGHGDGSGVGKIGGKKSRASFVTVLDYGATGDGSTDDTAAIQTLVDLKAGTIRFPAGNYRITRPIVVDLDKVGFTSLVADGTARLEMAGAGPAVKFIGNHAGTAAPETVKPEVWERQRMPAAEGLAIVGTHAEADGIEASGTMQLTVRGVHIRKCRHGIHLVGRNRNVLIDACHIYENSGCGVYLDHVNLHQTNISASHISYCGGGGVVVRGGEVRNVHIAGCDIEANMSAAGPPTANVLLDCADGSMAEVAITGCTIQHTNSAPESANIRILGRGFMNRRGEKLPFQCGHVTIGDNVLSDVQTNIHLAGARGVTITGNTFWQGYAHNLLIEDSQQIVLGANMLERNPLYGYTNEASNKVVFKGCRDCTIQGLHVHRVIEAEAGVVLDKCQRMHLTGCTILDCDSAALLVRDTTNSRIAGNLIRDDRPEAKAGAELVKVSGGSGNVVE
ncbi:MAG: right-handed parallel beta-helix repeat-containing protein [Planctomycetaceae bacterium]|nr:right-handed parallel beta-helix repeat-containing protein [Planctomycetaceae bacterium]